jgi:hypothetical protein
MQNLSNLGVKNFYIKRCVNNGHLRYVIAPC